MSPDQLIVIVVDDQAVMRSVIRRVLEKDGRFVVHDFGAGVDANRFLAKNSVDLVITDIYMNRGTGFDVLQAIRGREMASDIPVIFVSGEATRDDIVHAIGQGASDYLIKPFEADDLIAKIDKVLEQYQNPSREASLLRVADRAFLEGKITDSARIFASLLAEGLKTPRVCNGLAHCRFREGQLSEARQLATTATELNGIYYPAYALLADIALAEEQYSEARDFLIKELSINGKQLKRHVLLAELYLKESDEERAFEAYRQALLLSPQNESLLLSVGNAHLRCGHVDKAVHYFVRCRKHHPKSRKALEGIITAYRTSNRLDLARDTLSTLHRRNPGQWDIVLLRAKVFEAMGESEKALADYQAFLGRNPDDSDALRGTAHSLDKLGRFEEAATHWAQVAQLLPTPEVYARLGLSSLKSNDFPTAIRAYTRACELAPHDATVRYSLGFAFEQIKHYKKAYAAYLSAHRLHPDNEEILRAVQRAGALVRLQNGQERAKNVSPVPASSPRTSAGPATQAPTAEHQESAETGTDMLPERRRPKAS